jgi:hypothetical protein
MSGGHFNYAQYEIAMIADDLEGLILNNDDEIEGRRFTPETIAEFRKGLQVLREARIYAQRIDWLVSGDDGEERFHKRLADELRSLK